MNNKYDSIWYANDIPSKATIIKKIKKNDLPRELGVDFVWSEFYYFPNDAEKKYQLEFHFKLQAAVDQRLGNGAYLSTIGVQPRLMLCNMGKFGHGVFTKEELPKNSPVAFYIGKFTSAKADAAQDYLLEQSDNSQRAVDASFVRSFGGFFQHLPAIDNAHWVFHQDPTHKIATNNLRREDFQIDGWEVSLYLTEEFIPAGHILGFDYNVTNWLHRGITPACFTPQGEVYAQPIVTMSDPKYHSLIWTANHKLYRNLYYYLLRHESKQVDAKSFLEFLYNLNCYAVMAAALVSRDLPDEQQNRLLNDNLHTEPKKLMITFSTFLLQGNQNFIENMMCCAVFDAARECINFLAEFNKEELDCLRPSYEKGEGTYDFIAKNLKNDPVLSMGIIMILRYENLLIQDHQIYKTDKLDKFWDNNRAFMRFARECLHPDALAMHLEDEQKYKNIPVLPAADLSSTKLSTSRNRFLNETKADAKEASWCCPCTIL